MIRILMIRIITISDNNSKMDSNENDIKENDEDNETLF